VGSKIATVVPLRADVVRERVRANADRHRYNPLSPSREAGTRPFVFNEGNGELVVHLRGWLPDWWGLEARLALEPVGRGSTRLEARLGGRRADRVVAGCGLTLFVLIPLVAFAISSGRDLGMLPFLSLPLLLFVVVPLAYRLYRKDDQQLVQFLEDLFPEAHNWERAPR
jgi:hypothetical protein